MENIIIDEIKNISEKDLKSYLREILKQESTFAWKDLDEVLEKYDIDKNFSYSYSSVGKIYLTEKNTLYFEADFREIVISEEVKSFLEKILEDLKELSIKIKETEETVNDFFENDN
ncbi:MAG: hypothetical protein KGV54_00205 [Oceanivirga sp.]|nr:hypothetical protein [Oceanivirga sp.]